MREELHNTNCGLRRKDGLIIPPPPVINIPPVFKPRVDIVEGHRGDVGRGGRGGRGEQDVHGRVGRGKRAVSGRRVVYGGEYNTKLN